MHNHNEAQCIPFLQHVIAAFLLESFDAQRAKRMALRGMDATGRLRGDSHRYGLENWRQLLLRSGLDFSAWRMSRRPHLFDVYDELYREEVVGEEGEGGSGSERNCLPRFPGRPNSCIQRDLHWHAAGQGRRCAAR